MSRRNWEVEILPSHEIDPRVKFAEKRQQTRYRNEIFFQAARPSLWERTAITRLIEEYLISRRRAAGKAPASLSFSKK